MESRLEKQSRLQVQCLSNKKELEFYFQPAAAYWPLVVGAWTPLSLLHTQLNSQPCVDSCVRLSAEICEHHVGLHTGTKAWINFNSASHQNFSTLQNIWTRRQPEEEPDQPGAPVYSGENTLRFQSCLLSFSCVHHVWNEEMNWPPSPTINMNISLITVSCQEYQKRECYVKPLRKKILC